MKMPRTSFDTIRMAGGWDQMTPILSMPNGKVRDSLNFEAAITGGYTRIRGYERFDGQPSPSAQEFAVLYIDAFINIPVLNDVVTGQTTGITGIVVGIGVDHIAVSKTTGAFDSNEEIRVGALVIGNRTSSPALLPSLLKAVYKDNAADIYRTDITKVPGFGAVIGGFLYSDVLYAFRANAGNTATDIYKSSSSGWVQVPLYNEISFTAGGTGTPSDGDTLTQGGVTSTIKRVVLESGSWASGTAAGRFIVTNPAGGNFASGAATAGAIGVTLAAIQTAITMAVGGKIEYVQGNFAGSQSTDRIYGVDGINRAFEFDGDVYVPIASPVSPDNPKHIQKHKNYLWLSFGASLIGSAPALPYDYTALSGSLEIATGYDITGMAIMPGNQTSASMMVTSRSVYGVQMLYGDSSSTFKLSSMLTGSGAIGYTIQNMSQTYMLDDMGVIGLQTTLNFGNFESSALTYNITKFIEAQKDKAVCSVVDREKAQYRLFFNDGTALFITIANNKMLGMMKIVIPNIPYQAFEGRFSSGIRASFICTEDGYVMQMERGSSFDGGIISSLLSLAYNSTKSHRILKRYRKCALEISTASYAEINFGYQLGYGALSQAKEANYESLSDDFKWDNFTWDNFIWDPQNASPIPLELIMDGTAENVSIVLKSATDYIESYTLNTATLHYSMRRGMR